MLAIEEPEASEVAAALRADGVEIHTGLRAERVEHDGTRFTLRGGGGAEFTAERLLVVTGRQAHLTELGLATIGLDANRVTSRSTTGCTSPTTSGRSAT